MGLDSLFALAGIAGESIALSALVFRRGFRQFPVFSLYLAWGIASDVTGYYLGSHSADQYSRFYPVELVIDSIFQFGVLFELSRSVFRPVAKFLPRWFSIALGSLILVICASIWPLAQSHVFSDVTGPFRFLLRIQLAFAILRTLYFLALAGMSQLLSLSWRDRELQIATGLGIYSMVSVAVSVLHTRPAFDSLSLLLDVLSAASYLCSLLYWIVCFAQKEAARREFTPQMQSFLLALAGTTQTTRMDLSESTKPRKDRDARDSKE